MNISSLPLGLAREMNQNLPLELNFAEEARNIEKCRRLLNPMIQSGELAIPTVYHSSPRVLVMSFEEGCYLTDSKKIQEMGVDKGQVARLISKTFCEQM
jgi:predicted unusual protein kinase regulating ubiquinone biosynthesis (AarF/ABC1/UbiB family)